MSDAASTERLSAVVRAAARGDLPAWARVTPPRREHVARVVALLDEWAVALGLGEEERAEWLAAGWLHDSLRDADPQGLRPLLPAAQASLPPWLLHGPAAALRLEGVASESVRAAVAYHTIGHPTLDRLGKALYLADFLEPGRDFSVEWRASLRERMPAELDAVLVEVIASRIQHLLEVRKPIRPETAAFWSSVVGTEP